MRTSVMRDLETPNKNELSLLDRGLCKLVYKQMVAEAGKTGYDKILGIRSFEDPDPLGVLRLDKPHIPAAEVFYASAFNHIGNLLDARIINHEDRLAVIEELKEVLRDNLTHLEGGGNLAIATNHMSYADLLLLVHSLAMAELSVRGDTHIQDHHVLLNRSVPLFVMKGLRLLSKNNRPSEPTDGYVLEDALHVLGGVFQTIPPEQGGEELSDELRNLIGAAFLKSYIEVLEKGGQIILLAPSGTEDEIIGGGFVMGGVTKSTTRVLTLPNRLRVIKHDGSNREIPGPGLLTQAFSLDLQPLDSQRRPHGPVRAAAKRGGVFLARKPRDVDEVMSSVVDVGNDAKLEGTPQLVYYPPPDRRMAALALRS